MNFTCIELSGATYVPENIFPINNSWIIPATKNTAVLQMSDCKIILILDEQGAMNEIEIRRFIFVYQFLFRISEIYDFFTSTKKAISFIENGNKIDEIAQEINKKYSNGGCVKLPFDKIDTFYTGLPIQINFGEFYSRFVQKYDQDDNLKNIIDLFLYTIGSRHKLYENLFQKISQLQSVFETIVGKPKEKILSCGKSHFEEDWRPFLEKKLKEKGIQDMNEIALILKIKNTLNWAARVKYTHSCEQFNSNQKSLEEIKTGNHFTGKSEYTTNFADILSGALKVNDWAGLDWENVYQLYSIIIKRLIYLEYFQKEKVGQIS